MLSLCRKSPKTYIILMIFEVFLRFHDPDNHVICRSLCISNLILIVNADVVLKTIKEMMLSISVTVNTKDKMVNISCWVLLIDLQGHCFFTASCSLWRITELLQYGAFMWLSLLQNCLSINLKYFRRKYPNFGNPYQ